MDGGATNDGTDDRASVELRSSGSTRQGRPRAALNDRLLVEQHREGRTYAELAELHGVSSRTILSRLHGTPGFTPRARGTQPDPGRRERSLVMLEQYRSGLTLTEIGAQHGLTMERVRQLLVADTDYRSRQRQSRSTLDAT